MTTEKQFNQAQIKAVIAQNEMLLRVVDVARNLVALWESPKIIGLPRADRNAAIDGARQQLITAVHEIDVL
jgi:hypothetical protein